MFFNELSLREQYLLNTAITEFEEIQQTEHWLHFGLGLNSPFLDWFESLVDEDSQGVSLQYRMFQLRSIVFHSDPTNGAGASRDDEALKELKSLASANLLRKQSSSRLD